MKGVNINVDQELLEARKINNRIDVSLRNTHSGEITVKTFDHIVVEAGTLPNDSGFYSLKNSSLNNGVADLEAMVTGEPQPSFDGKGFHLYRVGDAVNSRDAHCAILDSLRICKNI